jgi:NitT/TauT family transport system substrate-binding protein
VASLALAALVLAGAITATGAAAEPLKIRYATWVGYGPLFVAREKGYFREEKVDVELVGIEDPREAALALAAGRIHGIAWTVDAMVVHLRTGQEYQYVLALDDSAGIDGLVARKDIRSVKDLRGKTVAVGEGTAAQFFLNAVLKDAGMSQKDVQVVNLSQGDAGAAFLAEKVDAAVTWEPWLTKARSAPHGQVLLDSSRTPGVMTEVLVFPREAIARQGKDIQGLVGAWYRAVAFHQKSPKESMEIMAKGLGDWLRDPRVVAETLAGVKLYDRDANLRFFGTPQKPGELYRIARSAIDIWGSLGKLQARGLAARDLVSHAFVK